jgi:hypothetical protein
MRRLLICLLCLLHIGTAFAGGLAGLKAAPSLPELPDPEPLLSGGAMLYAESFLLDDGFRGIAYAWPMPDNWTLFLTEYTALCTDAGYTVEKGMQQRQPAWMVSCGGKAVWLIPAYQGCLLMVADRAIPFAPIPTPEPTATPGPTAIPRPTAAPTSVPPGHWSYVSTRQDCFACTGGVCDLCDGSGWYRAYGEKIPCSRYCQTCDGLGWWEVTDLVWVYE